MVIAANRPGFYEAQGQLQATTVMRVV